MTNKIFCSAILEETGLGQFNKGVKHFCSVQWPLKKMVSKMTKRIFFLNFTDTFNTLSCYPCTFWSPRSFWPWAWPDWRNGRCPWSPTPFSGREFFDVWQLFLRKNLHLSADPGIFDGVQVWGDTWLLPLYIFKEVFHSFGLAEDTIVQLLRGRAKRKQMVT